MNYEKLEEYCSRIYKIVPKVAVYNENMSSEVVENYYSKSAFFYKKFHSPDGAMHLPISFDNTTPHKQKLLYQANSINDIINKHNYSDILELGCGMGFNTNYLATQNPAKNFTAIDLTANNITHAKSKGVKNANFIQNDFDSAVKEDRKYDLIFAIETLCHSKNLLELISNASKQLNENGKIIIFDGYVKENAKDLIKDFDKQAYKLFCWGFALSEFQKLDDVLNPQKLKGIQINELKNYTQNILPNATVFQNGAKKTLGYPWLLKICLKLRLLPLAFIKQLSAGVFLPYFLHNNYLGYYKLVISKKE